MTKSRSPKSEPGGMLVSYFGDANPQEQKKAKTEKKNQNRLKIKNEIESYKSDFYNFIYNASPIEKISLIKSGILASDLKKILEDIPISQKDGLKFLRIPVATVNKKIKEAKLLSIDESERVVGFASLVGQVESIVRQSGNPENFDARSWVAGWLVEPVPALGGVRPADLMDTIEGQNMVASTLAQIQSGAYA